MDLDALIAAKEEALKQMRNISNKNRKNAVIMLAEMQERHDALAERVSIVLREGQPLSVYASAMENAVTDESPRDSIRFGHQVLLLMTVHMLEAHESLLRTCCRQNRSLVKAIERRKRALREQNSEHEIEFMNRLSTQYEGMRELDNDYRRAIHAQGVVISRLMWKNAIPECPLPTIFISTEDYLREKQSAIHGSSDSRDDRKMLKAFASSMRNLMERDGSFPPPTDDDLVQTIDQQSLDKAIFEADDEPHADFTVSLDMPKGLKDSICGGCRRSSLLRRSSFDSADTMSTAGEELLQGIQSFFRGARGNRKYDEADEWSTR